MTAQGCYLCGATVIYLRRLPVFRYGRRGVAIEMAPDHDGDIAIQLGIDRGQYAVDAHPGTGWRLHGPRCSARVAA